MAPLSVCRTLSRSTLPRSTLHGGKPMLPKPKHLGSEYAAQFADRSVVAAYRHRPPYPAEVFDVLAGLIAAAPHAARAVLDAGCGTGDVARRLVSKVDRLDAVDPSSAMLEAGRRLPGGDDSHLRWVHGR